MPPQAKADGMIKHLASLSDERLIISFAPYTPYYAVLKRIGELFPGPSKVRWASRVLKNSNHWASIPALIFFKRP